MRGSQKEVRDAEKELKENEEKAKKPQNRFDNSLTRAIEAGKKNVCFISNTNR